MSRRSHDLPGSAGKRHAGPRAAGGTFQKCTELAGCEMHKSFLILFAMRCFLWKAVCSETGLYRLGRGQQKRSERNLAGALLHSGRGGWKRAVFLILAGRDSLTRQVRTVGGTSLATYFIKVVGEAPTGRSRRLIVTEHGIS